MFLVASRKKRKSAATISVESNIHSSNPSSQTGEDTDALIQSLTNDNQKLASDNQTLTNDNQKLTPENKKLKFENMVLQEKYDLLTYKRFVHSSEQETGNTAPQSLFDEEAEKTDAEAGTPEEKETITYTRKKNAGRSATGALSSFRSARERDASPFDFLYEYIDLSEEDKRCACGAEMEKIGVDVREKIEIVPMRIFVKRIEKAKYACPCCKGHPSDPDAPSVLCVFLETMPTTACVDHRPVARFPDGALYLLNPALAQPQFCRYFPDGVLPVDGSLNQSEPP
jgi:FtsZ-binding cell division protein ZapB